ncbi:MAG: uracil-DNA glycosylase family protein [Paracoccaceae bacterium]
MSNPDLAELSVKLRQCRLCADRFAATQTAHEPNPVVWFKPGARVLIAGQAPGLRVHKTTQPFTDPSGDRLRAWMGVDAEQFYDQSRIAIVPMAFCFPGYDEKGADLPPPRICAETWHGPIMQAMDSLDVILLVGGYAQKWHLGADAKGGVTRTVANWRDLAPRIFPLPHPSWRNTAWLKRNPWFEAELLPVLKTTLKTVLAK